MISAHLLPWRTRLVAGLALLAGAAPLAAQRPPITDQSRPFVSVDAPVVALTRVKLIDGTGAAPRDNQTIVIDGARIVAVGPTASTTVPPGARVLDLAGHTVIPGHVGLHEHTYFGGVKRTTQMSTSAPLLYLAFGVTTSMSAGSQLPYHERNMKRVVDTGRLPGPNFLLSAPYIDGGPPRLGQARILESADEAKRVLDYWADEGATWVKVQGRISRELLGAVVRAAHARGMRVTGHLCSITYAEASAIGVDLLQHGFITASDYVPNKQPDTCPPENMRIQADVDVGSPEVQASIRALAKTRTAVSSTLAVYETFSKARARLIPEAMEMLDPEVRKEVEQTHATLESPGGLPLPVRLLEKMMRWERDFVAAGGLLGAGSDPWGTGFLPGFGNVRNYELLREAGFSAGEAIRVMTLNGAKIVGLDDRVGAVTVGRQADLVVVRGDPAARPADLYQVVTVFRGGLGYDSMKLREAAKGLVGLR